MLPACESVPVLTFQRSVPHEPPDMGLPGPGHVMGPPLEPPPLLLELPPLLLPLPPPLELPEPELLLDPPLELPLLPPSIPPPELEPLLPAP